MTPRERWLAILNRQSYDRIPLDYRATPEFTTRLIEYLGCGDYASMLQRLHIDPVLSVGPRYVGPPLEPNKDAYGIGYLDFDYGMGTYHEAVSYPLAQYTTVEEIEANYQWPLADWWDYSDIPNQVKGHEDWVIQGGHCEEFAAYKHLRGVEQGYLDLIENPEMVHYCMGKLYDLQYAQLERIYEQIPGMVIWTWVADDLGTQEGLMVSLGHIREYFMPHMKRINQLVHEAGAYSFHHSDGAIARNLPQMIEVGMDVLDPVQWRCKGMEREGLKANFGDKLIFHGAMDNQYTLAFGTVEECRQEALDNLRILGEGGGLILGPCHNIQPISPPENVVAYYETAYEASRA
jgi:uroporphyrinogen decarboxylase